MKINEVEARAGITKKNIRFYEEQGLLNPRRNPENGYRDYGEEEVQILRRIRVLRKLGLPIEEIRRMQSGAQTVGDGMRRHLITLEREKRNTEQSIALCRELQGQEIQVSELDAEALLARMEEMERSGTTFHNQQNRDVRVRYIAPVIVTVVMVALMAGLSALLLWAYQVSPEDAPPVWFLWIMIGLFAAIGGGVLLALLQRVQEIAKGEIDDARNY
ncbi:MAG: MerR family transcriptional regulator [Ruminococcaceae bacterium]|nr:MerR family transcriptional regulator [Oscillospiraceae bacterium]